MIKVHICKIRVHIARFLDRKETSKGITGQSFCLGHPQPILMSFHPSLRSGRNNIKIGFGQPWQKLFPVIRFCRFFAVQKSRYKQLLFYKFNYYCLQYVQFWFFVVHYSGPQTSLRSRELVCSPENQFAVQRTSLQTSYQFANWF